MKNCSIEEINEIFLYDGYEIGFLIGNGINRYQDDGERSWKDLINNLSVELTNSPSNNSDISLTELYDIIGMKYKKIEIQKKIIKKLENWKHSNHHSKIVEKIKELNAPIITTNIDYLLEKSIGIENRMCSNFQDDDKPIYIPKAWKYYFSPRKIINPNNGFAIWHINGLQAYPESIRMGLTDYMGLVRYAHPLIHKFEQIPFSGKNIDYWNGYQTWLHIFFNKSFFIFGLGLEQQEVFLRWLLIERAKYFEKFPERKKKGWYIQTDKNANTAKNLFLKEVGIEVLHIENLKELYEDLWKFKSGTNNALSVHY